jgi:hypothetical protein
MNEINVPRPNNLDAFWMPYSDNKYFKDRPRMLARAEGMHYYTPEGREILDGTSGLWCCNAGHGRREIVEAIQKQAAIMDFAPAFQLGHPIAFEAAARVADMTPEGMDRVFFTNSGSEAADTALKIALAYHKARGESSRVRLIGRERGYHGVGFGGMSVGGIGPNRKQFGALLPYVDHLPHTHLPAKNSYCRGEPTHGAEVADVLENLVALHGAETIAAVMVEPVAGSTGVLVPPVDFIPLAEETGLIVPMSEWLLREAARQAKQIGSNLEATVKLTLPEVGFGHTIFADVPALQEFFILSDLHLTRGPALAATVEVCTNPKCERCWRLLPDVGTHAEHPTLCGRCVEAVQI